MDRSTIDMIIEANNIIDVIGSYIPLKKAGTNFKARCPFHEEKTASFVVSEKKQIYKCFGCGKSGNVVSFLMDYDKLSFPEAMKKLAARVGMEWKDKPENKQKKSRRELIYKIYQLATAHYKENLQNHSKSALDYLESRQISRNTVAKFDIGYALDGWAALKNYLIKNHINEQILEATGLFTNGSRGLIDIFQNRLIFPIHSSQGKVVAFGGRVIETDQKGGKYINSPTTEIYTKGNELYGLHITRHEIQRQDFALICEGYLDFLRLFESGFKNCAASLGTALTSSQINLISRYTHNFYLLYDGDKAGKKAAVKAAGNVLSKGYSVKIINLPKEEDPDSFLLKMGSKALEKEIQKAKTLVNFVKTDSDMGFSKKEKLDLLLEVAMMIDDKIASELYLQEISEIFSLSINSLFSSLSKSRKPYQKKKISKIELNLNQYQEERDLLKLMLNDVSLVKKVAEELDSDYFLFDIYKMVYNGILEFSDKINQGNQLLNMIDNEIIRNTIGELLMEEITNNSIDEAVQTVKLRKYQEEIKAINQKISQEGNTEELLIEKNRIKKLILSLNKKVVNKTLFH